MKLYDAREVFRAFENNKYPFDEGETIIRVRHFGILPNEILEGIQVHMRCCGIELKTVEVVYLKNEGKADFVSLFDASDRIIFRTPHTYEEHEI